MRFRYFQFSEGIGFKTLPTIYIFYLILEKDNIMRSTSPQGSNKKYKLSVES